MSYSSDYSKSLKYARTTSFDSPEYGELGSMYKAAVNSEGDEQDTTAAKALADWLQDRDDWRHHLFANPSKPDANLVGVVDKPVPEVVHHNEPKSKTSVQFYPHTDKVFMWTQLPDHNGSYGDHFTSTLTGDQYHQLRKEASTAGVEFPPHPHFGEE